MVLNIHAVTEGVARTIGWVSLRPNNWISVGLSDRTFISPRFHARQFVWNAYNRVSLQYLVPHSPEDLVAVVNPHLSFHPPIYFHLHANRGQELFAGIADVAIMLAQDRHVPWVRFVSRSVDQLPVFAAPRDPERTRFLAVPIDDVHVSVGLAVDFVRPEAGSLVGAAVEQFLDCGQFRLRVCCEVLPPQVATLSWYHQY